MSENPKELHRPGIEPGPPAWQASILPLNHRCAVLTEMPTVVLKKNSVKTLTTVSKVSHNFHTISFLQLPLVIPILQKFYAFLIFF
nr:hypothetical protein C30E1.1 - Caenorhabditis elegans [Caenorhabditis elegans]